MDLLKIIIDAETSRNTCFLCFKLCDNGADIYDIIDVQVKSVDIFIKTSLWNIMNNLFLSHNILFSKACNECVEDLKKIYCKFQLSHAKIENLNQIVDVINNNIPENSSLSKIRIDIPISVVKIKSQTKNNIQNDKNSCKECDMNFTSKKLLHEHNYFTHKNQSQSKVCYICGKNCENPKALKSHLNSHNEKACPYCQAKLRTHAHFNRHVKIHATYVKTTRNRNNYNCDCCPYKTTNKTDLESHKNKVHLKIRPYQCEICSKSFYKKSNLTAHLLTHNKRSDLICELCGSNFSVKKTLIQHLKLHEGVKEYECNFCKRKFVTQSRRNEHIKRNHSNEYLYSCPYCVKKYTLKKDMNSHFRRAHHKFLEEEQNCV